MTNEQQQSPKFCLDKLKKHLYNTIWGIKQLLMYATKTIWFCEEINRRGIKLLKIEATEQLGDMFTKGLAKPTFEYL